MRFNFFDYGVAGKESKAFNFGAPPEAIQSLNWAGIDGVSLANNHTLDYGVEGLLETADLLNLKRVEFNFPEPDSI
jgi:hypothetical protein